MTILIEDLRTELLAHELPGGEIRIEPHEAAVGDPAWRAGEDPDGLAHPMWFIIASLRCMGITVDELCALARQADDDTLLFGSCAVTQVHPLRVGDSYAVSAGFTSIHSRVTRAGVRLDSLEVRVALVDSTGVHMGDVTSEYLFKRGVSS